MKKHHGGEIRDEVRDAVGCLGSEEGEDSEGREGLEILGSFAGRLLVLHFHFGKRDGRVEN